MIDTAVILAGGQGKRLRPLTDTKPKSMVKVGGRPIIEWILLWLRKNGVTNIIVSVDYQKEVLMDYCGPGERFGVRITYHDHTGCDETGAALKRLLERHVMPQTFLVLYGDQITDLPIKELEATHERHRPLVTLVTCPVRMPYGIIETTRGGAVLQFREKPVLQEILMNSGIYVFEKDIAQHIGEAGPVAKTTLEALAQKGAVHAHTYDGFFITMNDIKDLEEGERLVKERGNSLLVL